MAARKPLAIAVLSMAMAIGVLGVHAQPVAAAGGVTQTGATTYELDPAHGLIRVTETLKVKNTIPNSTTPYDCIKYTYDYWYGYMPYTATCYRTTRYYVNSTQAVIENQASSIKATAGGSSLKVKLGSKGSYYRTATISLPKFFNGTTRTVRLTYVIKGGAPRSTSTTRVMRAYASFCATPSGFDGGSVTVRVPAGFDFATAGGSMSSKVTGNTRIYKSGKVADTSSFFVCFYGANAGGYKTETLTADGGRIVTLKSWPEDPAWANAVRSDVANGLPELATLIGEPMPGTAPLMIQETVTGSEYAGFYDQDTNTITVSEDFNQPSLVDHELAHVWFNGAVFDDRWLSEGNAEWAARATAKDQPACGRPVTTGTPIKLDTWVVLTPQSTDADRQGVVAEYDASCYIVTQVATAGGFDRMQAALQALLEGRDPYATDPTAKRTSSVASWRDWLDAVDELVLQPAGASPVLASDLLLQYGVTDDRGLLDQRTDARAAYHRLAAEVGDWIVPPAVRTPLAAWDFTQAQTAAAAAEDAWNLTGQADATLVGIDARHGPAAEAWADAMTTPDLIASTDLAQAQLDAAKDVAETMALADAPLDFVQQVGLIGTTLPDAKPAVAAVRDGDFDRAGQITASVKSSIDGLRDAGQLRLLVAGAVLGALLLLLLLAVALRLRRRRTRAVTAAAMPGDGGPLPETVFPENLPTQLAEPMGSVSRAEDVSAPARPAVDGDAMEALSNRPTDQDAQTNLWPT